MMANATVRVLYKPPPKYRTELAQWPADRDAALANATAMIDALRWEVGAAQAELTTARELIDRDTALILEQSREIWRLRDEVDAAKAGHVKATSGPPNPFRDFPGDRRRIGA